MLNRLESNQESKYLLFEVKLNQFKAKNGRFTIKIVHKKFIPNKNHLNSKKCVYFAFFLDQSEHKVLYQPIVNSVSPDFVNPERSEWNKNSKKYTEKRFMKNKSDSSVIKSFMW